MSRQIYLDYAAATPMSAEVLAAMEPYFSAQFHNPSATYLSARSADKAVADARASVASCLGARPSEIIFTSGATEANNLAIHGLMRRFTDGNVVVSAIEHESVLAPARRHEHKIVPVTQDGIVRTDALADLIDEKTVLVSIMYANNEVGTVQPLKELARTIASARERRQAEGNNMPLYLHTDSAQAANYLDIHVSRLGVDMMSLNGGKLYGPKGIGALFVKAGIVLQPLLDGGGQERGARSGTENVPAIVGFAKALETATGMRHAETKRLQVLQARFMSTLEERGCTINGSRKLRLPNNVHVTFPGQDNERLMMSLDEHGILCAAGSACSASKDEPSHVLKAMGQDDDDARSSLRFSMGRDTIDADIDRTLQVLAELLS